MIRLLIKGWNKENKILLRDCLFYAYWKAVEHGGMESLFVTKCFADALSWLEANIANM